MREAYDHYAEARRVIAAMREEGLQDPAQALDDAIAAGFTSTEILMVLRWHLAQFLSAQPAGSGALRQSAEALHKRIDATLDQSG